MAGDFTLEGGGDTFAITLADHWTDLADYTESLRNVIARPGTFADLFPETTDDGLVLVLQDALAECHLEQTLINYTSDANGLVRPTLTSGQAALVVLYGGVRLIRAELLNRVTNARYVAGPVSAETTYATNILRDIMKALQAQKDRVTAIQATSGASSAFYMADQYVFRAIGYNPTPLALTW